MIDAVTVGETMALVRTHREGRPLNQDSCTLALGGAESNVAIGLARLGHSVRWVSALGEDGLGDMIQSAVGLEGVEVVAPRTSDRPTGLMIKSLSTGPERFVSYYRAGSAAAELNVSSISEDMLRDARLLHLTGITPALSESARDLSLDVARRGRLLGLTVSLDINYRAALWSVSQAAPILRELALQSDIIFGDRAELEVLLEDAPSSEHELLSAVAAFGASQVVLKRGDRGAAAYVRGDFFEHSAIPVDLVDTVGAGDAFVAGYLSGWFDSAKPDDCVRRGVICGARACQHAGDWEGAPTRAELEATQVELAS
jgi:2-dehydro-3-deoxygluconokinase